MTQKQTPPPLFSKNLMDPEFQLLYIHDHTFRIVAGINDIESI